MDTEPVVTYDAPSDRLTVVLLRNCPPQTQDTTRAGDIIIQVGGDGFGRIVNVQIVGLRHLIGRKK